LFANLKELNWRLGNPSFYVEMGRVVYNNTVRRWIKLEYYLGNLNGYKKNLFFGVVAYGIRLVVKYPQI